MNLTIDNIRYITFWKRNPNSVESTFKLTFQSQTDGFLLITEKDNRQERQLSNNEVSSLLKILLEDLHLEETEETYRAFRYEDNQSDFTLKFFLEIDTKDFDYLAIKGIHPFKQPNYKEIISLFNPFFES